MIELAEKTIQTTDAASDIFNQIMDQLGSTDSLKQIATIIGDMKTFLMKGIGLYKIAPNSIFGWCDTVKSLLTAYNDQKLTSSSKQREIIKVLDYGETVMNDAQNWLQKCGWHFNKAAGKLNTLENRLANDLDENSNKSLKKLIAELNGKVATIREFFEKFICTKDHLTKEIRDIGDFKVQTEETKSYVSLDDIPDLKDTVKESTQKVIAKCEEYHKKYE